MSWTNAGLTFLFAGAASFVIWRKLEPKALVIFIAGLIIAEVFIQLRWRLTIPCPHCRFDPLIYLRNPEFAAKNVREYYDWRRSRSDFYLTSRALIETQKRMQERAREKKWELPRITKQKATQELIRSKFRRGRLLSKDV